VIVEIVVLFHPNLKTNIRMLEVSVEVLTAKTFSMGTEVQWGLDLELDLEMDWEVEMIPNPHSGNGIQWRERV
jgi:hypothetical protein